MKVHIYHILETNKNPKTLPQTSILSTIQNGLKKISSIFEIIPDDSEDDNESNDEDDNESETKKALPIKKRRELIRRRAMQNNTSTTNELESEDVSNDSTSISPSPPSKKKKSKIGPVKIEINESRDCLQVRLPKKSYNYNNTTKSKSWHVISTVTTETDEFEITEVEEVDDNGQGCETAEAVSLSLDKINKN